MKSKISSVIVIVIIAILAIVGIIFLGKIKKGNTKVEYYVGKTSDRFDNQLINDYKEFRKFTRDISLEKLRKDNKNYDVSDLFNEEYFENKKLAVIGIYEDDSSDYYYEIHKVEYNEDRTNVTIEYTEKSSGYNGSFSIFWTNCIIIELDNTVNDVEFVKLES